MKIMMSPLSLHDIFNGFIKVEPAPTHSYLCTETIPVNPKWRGQPKVTRQVRTENLMQLVIMVGAWTRTQTQTWIWRWRSSLQQRSRKPHSQKQGTLVDLPTRSVLDRGKEMKFKFKLPCREPLIRGLKGTPAPLSLHMSLI